MTTDTLFIHLRVHSEYSLIDGLIPIKPYIKALQHAQMPAAAITDQGNLFALVKFYTAAHNAGIKPIIGVDVWLRAPDGDSRLVLLCQNLIGYRNLTALISRAYQQGQDKEIPYIHQAWLEGHCDGLIALSGGREGDVGQALLAKNPVVAELRLSFWQKLFPQRYYLELQRTGRPEEETYLHAAVQLALTHQIPVVATNDVRFLARADFTAHEARVCIHNGYTLEDAKRPRQYSAQQYLRDAREMHTLFADLPEAIENTWHIAQRCNLELTLGKNFLPQFPIPQGKSTAQWFSEQCEQGLEARLDFLFGADKAAKRQPYDERLAIEIEVIVKMDFPGYFLIVADFIQWAKNQAIPVGPGRGSGAGSLVAYALKITDLDPLEYDLLFERFLNPERVSMPDFDVDFCMDRRDEVIDYVAGQYGREKVSQIITYGSMTAKAVVRDVGRVMGMSYGFVDKIAKLIPFDLGITLAKALAQEEELNRRYQEEEEVRELIDLAQKLEGLARNAGTHAGGVVIAPSKLTDFAPLYCEPDGTNLVTQFDKNDVEAVGLVKFDFLGLRTLTIIDWALATINHSLSTTQVDIARIDLHDSATFQLLKRAQTTAVFQLESRGMKELIKRMQPDCFEDLIALVALFRPGPLQSGMVDDFINRKHGKAQIAYLHPDLQTNRSLIEILKPTYGVIVYQEQVMQIGQVLAGYSLGGADLLRRAMGKKKPEEMAKQRGMFVEGCVKNSISADTAEYIFDLIQNFAEYGFNKSHSAAYALVAYQTAWLKAHYPAPFMAATLTADMDNTDKVVGLIEECRLMGLTLKPPCINLSVYRFEVAPEAKNTILYGLGAIKGAGEAALSGIIKERAQHGPYSDLFDFTRRVDARKCNRRVLDSLIKAGALDTFGVERSSLMESVNDALKRAEQYHKNQSHGIHDMFGLNAPTSDACEQDHYLPAAPWSLEERLGYEKETLGLYLTGHPLDAYAEEIRALCKPLAEVKPAAHHQVKIAGVVQAMRMMNSRRGKMASLTVEDPSGRLEAVFYAEEYQRYQNLLNKDSLLLLEGEISEDTFSGGYTMNVSQAWDLPQARAQLAKRLILTLSAPLASPQSWVHELQNTLRSHRAENGCPIHIRLQSGKLRAHLQLGPQWQVRPCLELLQHLQKLAGQDAVAIHYR